MITFDESNVDDQFEIEVDEEILDEAFVFQLNANQIAMETGNLLAAGFKNPMLVKHKQELVLSLLKDSTPFKPPNTLIPIVKLLKYITYDNLKPPMLYDPDPINDPARFIKSESLSNYLTRFKAHANLDVLQFAYESSGTEKITFASDAKRHCIFGVDCLRSSENDWLRLVVGDSVDIVGYLTSPDDKYQQLFDLNEYFTHLDKLKEQDTVHVFFNHFVYKNGSPLDHCDGTISLIDKDTITITLDWVVSCYGVENTQLVFRKRSPYNLCYVFPAGFKGFSKKTLLHEPFAIKLQNTKDLAWVLPNTPGELLYIFEKVDPALNEVNRQNLQRTKLPYGAITAYTSDPPSISTYPVWETWTRRLSFYNFKNLDYVPARLDNDLSRAIYLHSKTCKMLTIKERVIDIEEDRDKFEKELQDISKELQTKNSTPVKPYYALSKEYHDVKDLRADYNRELRFDSKYDKTPYHLINQSNQKHVLIHLLKQEGYIDPEFEANCIIKKHRPVRVGDYARLYVHGKSEYYIRQTVEGSEMWVKVVTKAPFKVCAAKLPTFQMDNPNILDPFDIMCKRAEDTKVSRLLSKLHLLEQILDYEKSVSRQADCNLINKRDEKQHLYVSFFKEYFDESVEDQDEMVDQEFDKLVMTKEPVSKKENQDILQILAAASDIHLEQDHISFIMDYALKKYPPTDLVQSLENAKALIAKRRNDAMTKLKFELENHPQKKRELEAGYAEFLNRKTIDLQKQYYEKVVILLTSLLILVVLTHELSVGKLDPRCVKLFAYFEEHDRSFAKYMACVITHLTSPNDPKFGGFFDQKREKIETEIQKEINQILKKNAKLQNLLEENKQNKTRAAPGTAVKNTNAINLHHYRPIVVGQLRQKFQGPEEFAQEPEDLVLEMTELKIVHSLKPSMHFTDREDLFQARAIEFITPTIATADAPLIDGLEAFEEIEDMYTKLLDIYNVVKTIVTQKTEDKDGLFVKFYELFVEQSSLRNNIRTTLKEFMASKAKKLLGISTSKFMSYWHDDEKTNIMILAYLFMQLCAEKLAAGQALELPELIIYCNRDDTYDDTLDSAECILLALSGLMDSINMNDLNIPSIQSANEALRERLKEYTMTLYSQDDEVRQLQRQMIKMVTNNTYLHKTMEIVKNADEPYVGENADDL